MLIGTHGIQIESTFSSEITSTHVYCQLDECETPEYYYQSIRLHASVTGMYWIVSNSSIDTYGSLYDNSFDPNEPSINLILVDDDGAGSHQFKLVVVLESMMQYFLVVSTYDPFVTGPYSIVIVGNGTVSFALN